MKYGKQTQILLTCALHTKQHIIPLITNIALCVGLKLHSPQLIHVCEATLGPCHLARIRERVLEVMAVAKWLDASSNERVSSSESVENLSRRVRWRGHHLQWHTGEWTLHHLYANYYVGIWPIWVACCDAIGWRAGTELNMPFGVCRRGILH